MCASSKAEYLLSHVTSGSRMQGCCRGRLSKHGEGSWEQFPHQHTPSRLYRVGRQGRRSCGRSHVTSARMRTGGNVCPYSPGPTSVKGLTPKECLQPPNQGRPRSMSMMQECCRESREGSIVDIHVGQSLLIVVEVRHFTRYSHHPQECCPRLQELPHLNRFLLPGTIGCVPHQAGQPGGAERA